MGTDYIDKGTVLKFGMSKSLYITMKTLIGNFKKHINFVSVGVLLRMVLLYELIYEG